MVTHPLWRPYTPRANANRQSQRVAHRQVQPGPLQEHRDVWEVQYNELRRLIEAAIPDQVIGTQARSRRVPIDLPGRSRRRRASATHLHHAKCKLHVWNPGAMEPQRHQLFTRWLRANPRDRERYATAKVGAAGSDGTRRYNDLKSAVVYDIYERAFLADTANEHDPQPRDFSGEPAPG